MLGSAFARLTVADDGTASGRFLVWDIYFMTVRPRCPPPLASPHLGFGSVRDGRVDPHVLDALAEPLRVRAICVRDDRRCQDIRGRRSPWRSSSTSRRRSESGGDQVGQNHCGDTHTWLAPS